MDDYDSNQFHDYVSETSPTMIETFDFNQYNYDYDYVSDLILRSNSSVVERIFEELWRQYNTAATRPIVELLFASFRTGIGLRIEEINGLLDAVTVLEVTVLLYPFLLFTSLLLCLVVLLRKFKSNVGVTGVLDPDNLDTQFLMLTSGEVVEEMSQATQEIELNEVETQNDCMQR